MPAIKKPVRNRRMKSSLAVVAHQATAMLNRLPNRVQTKNNLTGEKRSAREKRANTNVPAINPICTAVVTWLTAYELNCNVFFNSGKMALPANHNDVPANWERIMRGRICAGFFCNGL